MNRTSTGLGPVREQNWHGYIDNITTKTEPPQPIPRFNDVLDYLIQPEISEGKKGLYMIVDIKVKRNPHDSVFCNTFSHLLLSILVW